MKKFFSLSLLVLSLAVAFTSQSADACATCGGHAFSAPPPTANPCYIDPCQVPYFPGNPASNGYPGVGRYPLQPFATPLRPWGGLTPVRQFFVGRGMIRRQVRRAAIFGGCGANCY